MARVPPDSAGSIIAGILSLALVIGAVVFGRRPYAGSASKQRTAAAERARLVAQREALVDEARSGRRALREQRQVVGMRSRR